MIDKPTVGDMIPDIALEKPDGSIVRPSDFRGRGAVLFFYPKDMTPGCTTEAIEFSALKPQFDQLGVALLGISKDSPDRHRKFATKHALTVDLATDAEDGAYPTRSVSGRRSSSTGSAFWAWSARLICSVPTAALHTSGTR